jgi:phosphoribosylaminoimidazolecarboxamide formyltransferase/IMP cyclohydrolase
LNVSNWFFENDVPLESKKLRYGENPHQEGFLSMVGKTPINFHDPIQGKEISYNNVSDALAAWACVNEFSEPSVCIVKHTNPCGVASNKTVLEAYQRAFQTDPTSAFGGVIACNELVDETCAKTMLENQFIEVLVAPSYSEEAINILQEKPNIRVLLSNDVETDNYENKMIHGIGLIQSTDLLDISEIDLEFATKNKPNKKDIEDLIFAMKVAKHAKSNAIVLAKNKMTLGVGAGQMSRVVSTKIAFMKAEEEGLDVANCVLASDAFFPFRDNIDLAAEKGISHIIQPGGSVKDEEVIQAAEENNITMTLTGIRHFKH